MKRLFPLVAIVLGTFLWGSGKVVDGDSLANRLDNQRYQFLDEFRECYSGTDYNVPASNEYDWNWDVFFELFNIK